MDFIQDDLLYTYKGEYDNTGVFNMTGEIKAICNGLNGKGKPIIKIIEGSEYLTAATAAGQRWIKVGSKTNTNRQAGMFFDSVSAMAPRLVVYSGLDSFSKLFSATITKVAIGNLGWIHDTDFGWLTSDGNSGGNPLYGIYTDNAFFKGRLKVIGDSFFQGDITLSGPGAIRTLNAGVGANGIVISAAGIRGYSSTLGTVFSIPTDGSAPRFSSGVIEYTAFEVNTNAVIRTSATVGDGSAASAGILINNTGFYACEANQTLANANIKILIDGSASFKGTVTAAAGTIGGFTLAAGSLSSTNVGILSGASAMILLGHPSDYATAKIGFKNDGSGKIASGNFSWDTSGNITASGTWTNTAVITGGTLQTATTGGRIVLNSNGLKIFGSSSDNTYLILNTSTLPYLAFYSDVSGTPTSYGQMGASDVVVDNEETSTIGIRFLSSGNMQFAQVGASSLFATKYLYKTSAQEITASSALREVDAALGTIILISTTNYTTLNNIKNPKAGQRVTLVNVSGNNITLSETSGNLNLSGSTVTLPATYGVVDMLYIAATSKWIQASAVITN